MDHKLVLDLLAEQIDDPIFLDPIPKFLMNPGESADRITFPNNGMGLPLTHLSLESPISQGWKQAARSSALALY